MIGDVRNWAIEILNSCGGELLIFEQAKVMVIWQCRGDMGRRYIIRTTKEKLTECCALLNDSGFKSIIVS